MIQTQLWKGEIFHSEFDPSLLNQAWRKISEFIFTFYPWKELWMRFGKYGASKIKFDELLQEQLTFKELKDIDVTNLSIQDFGKTATNWSLSMNVSQEYLD